MEYSLINCTFGDRVYIHRLNPYSNGILSDTLSKSTLPFYAFPILQQNPP